MMFTPRLQFFISVSLLLLPLLSSCEKPHLPKGSHVKVIQLDGTKNFRDIGGYNNWENKKIKYGQIYRSDQLSELSDDDINTFKALGIKTVIDLRSNKERKAKPNRLPNDVALTIVHLPITLSELQPDKMANALRNGDLDYPSAKQQMIGGYQEIIQSYSPALRVILETVSDPNSLPVVIHCTAGKDRTGVTIATIMLALGTYEDFSI